MGVSEVQETSPPASRSSFGWKGSFVLSMRNRGIVSLVCLIAVWSISKCHDRKCNLSLEDKAFFFQFSTT